MKQHTLASRSVCRYCISDLELEATMPKGLASQVLASSGAATSAAIAALGRRGRGSRLL